MVLSFPFPCDPKPQIPNPVSPTDEAPRRPKLQRTRGKQQEFITSTLGAVTTSDTYNAGVDGEVEVAEEGRADGRTEGV